MQEKGRKREEQGRIRKNERKDERRKKMKEKREREREGFGQMAFEPLLFLFYSFTTPLPSQIFNFPSQVPFFIFQCSFAQFCLMRQDYYKTKCYGLRNTQEKYFRKIKLIRVGPMVILKCPQCPCTRFSQKIEKRICSCQNRKGENTLSNSLSNNYCDNKF